MMYQINKTSFFLMKTFNSYFKYLYCYGRNDKGGYIGYIEFDLILKFKNQERYQYRSFSTVN